MQTGGEFLGGGSGGVLPDVPGWSCSGELPNRASALGVFAYESLRLVSILAHEKGGATSHSWCSKNDPSAATARFSSRRPSKGGIRFGRIATRLSCVVARDTKDPRFPRRLRKNRVCRQSSSKRRPATRQERHWRP